MSIRDKILERAEGVGELIDMAALAVAPEWAVKRAASRKRHEILASYDAGSTRKRSSKWRGSSTSINTETRKSLQLIRHRSRSLVENNEWAKRAVHVIQRNVVGDGIRPTSKDSAEMQKLLRQVCDRSRLDVRGRETLYGLQSNVMHTTAQDGECLILRRRLSTREMIERGTPIPVQLKVIEADYLDHTKDGRLQNGGQIVQGVEVDRDGRAIAYHMHREHPGERRMWTDIESIRVPARDVIHVFDEWRPGQMRGIPWLVTVMMRLKDFGDYEDATLMRQKIASTFAVFIRASHESIDPDGNPAWDQMGVPEKVSPGMIEYLRPGEEITFATPPGNDGYEAYCRTSARAAAAGVDITYEALTGDYSQVNYSSARMGWLEMHRAIRQWQSQLLIPQFCHRVEDWIREAAALVGVSDGGEPWRWTAPKREMIDPVKETSAAIAGIRSGLTSRAAEVSKMGRNVEDVDEEIRSDNERMDQLALMLDSDPRKQTQQGQMQQLALMAQD